MRSVGSQGVLHILINSAATRRSKAIYRAASRIFSLSPVSSKPPSTASSPEKPRSLSAACGSERTSTSFNFRDRRPQPLLDEAWKRGDGQRPRATAPILDARREMPDIILMDMSLPVMDG